MPVITYQLIQHKNQNKILIRFEPNAAWNKRIQKVPGVRWSKNFKGWTIPDTAENRIKCRLEQSNPVKVPTAYLPASNPHVAKTSTEALGVINDSNRQQMKYFLEQLALKAYSPSTVRTYRNEFAQLLRCLGNHSVEKMQPDDIKRYLLYCINKGLSEHALHSRINALKFYFEQVLHRDKFFFEIPRPSRPLQLPKVLSKEEIALVIKAIKNVKHKTMIMLAYGCGLRVGEIIRLTINNVDGKRRLLFIERGKGKKDRVISLSPALLIMLREYYRQYKPKKFLFEGVSPGEPYSIRSLEEIIKAAKQKAGITKSGSMHMLRHSFATHLLDKGTDVVLIQKLLGHNDIKTTLRYLHVTNKDLLNIISPIEDIQQLL